MNFQKFFQSLVPWLLSHGIKIILILFAAYLINRFGKKFVEKAIKKGVRDTTDEATEKRQKTLIC